MVLIFSAIYCDSIAGRNEGINVQYECVGGNDYLITVHLFRDCAEFTDTPPFLDVFFTSSCQSLGFIEIDFEESFEVSQLCPDSLPFSSCSGGSLPGVDLSVFTGVVTLPPCSDWQIIVAEQNRAEVVNLNDPMGDSRIHVEAFLNNLDGACNTSPQVGLFNLPFVCVGNNFFYNLSFSDPDGDSLVYSLAPAMTSPQADMPTPMTYEPGYGPQNPVNTIDFNDETGQMNLNPDMEGKYTVVVQVEEFREGILIGRVALDFNVIVIPCAVPPPTPVPGTLEHVDGGAYPVGENVMSVCPGDDFCFELDFASTDPTVNLTLSSDLDQLLQDATSTQTGNNPATIEFCGTVPPDFNGGTFVVSAIDDFCPIYGQAFYAVQFTLREPLQAGDDITLCQGESIQLSAQNDTAYTWFDLAGEMIPAGPSFSCNPCNDPVVTIDTSTALVVEGMYSESSCANRDTVFITVPLETEIEIVPETCYENDGVIEINVLTGSGDYNVEWADDPTSELVRTDLNEGNYSVTITDQVYGCSKSFDFFVDHLTFPDANAGGDEFSCGLSFQTNAIPSFGASSWTALQEGVTIDQATSPQADITVPSEGLYQFVWEENDGDGCMDRDTLQIEFFEAPVSQLTAPDSVCGVSTPVEITTDNGILNWVVSSEVQVEQIPSDEWLISSTEEGNEEVVLTVENGPCLAADTVVIAFISQPEAQIQEDLIFCGPDGLLTSIPSVGIGEWILPEGLSSSGDPSDISLPIEAADFMVYEVIWYEENTSYCSDADTATVTFIEIPVLPALTDTVVCGTTLEYSADIVADEILWTSEEPMEIFGESTASPEIIADSGDYSVIATATNGGICEVSDTLQISFLDQPDFPTISTDTVCGVSTEINQNVNGFTATWSSDELAIDELTDNQVSVEAPEQGWYELLLVVDNEETCFDTTHFELQFYDQPQVVLDPTMEFCGLTATVEADVTAIGSIEWYTPSEDIQVEALNDSIAQLTANDYGAFWLILSEVNGICSGTDSSEVIFDPFPEMQVDWDPEFCSGDSALVIIALEGEGPFNIDWTNQLTTENLSVVSDTAIFVTEGGTYSFSQPTDQRCSSDSVAAFDIVEHALPSADAGPDLLLCTGDSVAIGMTSEPGVDYEWESHPGISDLNVSDPVFTETNTGAFPMDIQLVLSAQDDNCLLRDTLFIDLYPDPQLEIILPSLLCEGDTSDIFAYGATDFNWTPIEYFGSADSSQSEFFPPPGQWEIALEGSNEAGCSSIAVQVVDVIPEPEAEFLLVPDEGCEPLSVEVLADQVTNGAQYNWSINREVYPESIPQWTKDFDEGIHTIGLEVVSAEGCRSSVQALDSVEVHGIRAELVFSPEDPSISDPVVRFDDQSGGSVFSSWNIDTLTTLTGNPVSFAFPDDEGNTYQVCLNTISNEGCMDSLCVNVEIADDFFIYVPSAFTPDGDGINDLFFPQLSRIDVADYHFRIFDRRGTMVFETKDPNEKWDGTERESTYFGATGIYQWELVAKPDFNVETRTYTGTVTLIR